MKKQLFSLVIMLALVIVAGTAMAQTKSTPYPGGTYDYTVNGIVVQTAGTGKIEYLDAVTNLPLTGVTFSAVTGFTGTAPNYTVATGGIILTFKATYATVVSAGKIRITVTDGATTGGCTNFIEMAITPAVLPTFAVAISNVTSSPYCQTTTLTPANVTAASVGQTNTITFTVTPTVDHVTSDYSYTYAINLAGAGLTGYNITSTNAGYSSGVVTSTRLAGAAPSVDTFTATFTTTTGIAPVIIPGAISAASITITSAGGGTYNAPVTTAAPVTVNTLPSIGTFN